MNGKGRKAIVALLPGLGDALAASPILRGLDASGYSISALTMLEPVREYARGLECVSEVHHVDLLAEGWRAGIRLRKFKGNYDVLFLPFPATRWQYHAVAVAIGARTTVTHDYGGLAAAIGAVWRFQPVQLRGGRRAAENARLLSPLGIEVDDLRYLLPDKWISPNRQRGLLGVHTGSMRYKGNETRRWPLERFCAVINKQISKGRTVRLFLGPNETEDREKILKLVKREAVTIVEAPLQRAAQLISECEAFLGNDAGLAHVAAGACVRTAVVFGMTDPARALPIGPAMAVRPSVCPPCHDEGLRTFSCVRGLNYMCLHVEATVEAVDSAVDSLFREEPRYPVEMEGAFHLYGRLRAPISLNHA